MMDLAHRVHILVEHADLRGSLEDLEWERQVHDPRHARQKTLEQRIGGGAVGGVLLLAGERVRQVRQLVAVDHAPAGGNLLGRRVILDVEVRRVHRLPEPREVGLPLRRPRNLRRRRHRREPQDDISAFRRATTLHLLMTGFGKTIAAIAAGHPAALRRHLAGRAPRDAARSPCATRSWTTTARCAPRWSTRSRTTSTGRSRTRTSTRTRSRASSQGLGDQFSNYLTPKETKEFEESVQGEFEGVGMNVDEDRRGLRVINVFDGSPGQEGRHQEGRLHHRGERPLDRRRVQRRGHRPHQGPGRHQGPPRGRGPRHRRARARSRSSASGSRCPWPRAGSRSATGSATAWWS